MNNRNYNMNGYNSTAPVSSPPCNAPGCGGQMSQMPMNNSYAGNSAPITTSMSGTSGMTPLMFTDTPTNTAQQMGGFTAIPQLSQLAGAPSPLLTAGGAGSYFPITQGENPVPVSINDVQYLNGFLKTQVGRRVHVEFLIGTNTMTDRYGTLLGVGENFILINEFETNDILACDFYNIKFVRFFY